MNERTKQKIDIYLEEIMAMKRKLQLDATYKIVYHMRKFLKK